MVGLLSPGQGPNPAELLGDRKSSLFSGRNPGGAGLARARREPRRVRPGPTRREPSLYSITATPNHFLNSACCCDTQKASSPLARSAADWPPGDAPAIASTLVATVRLPEARSPARAAVSSTPRSQPNTSSEPPSPITFSTSAPTVSLPPRTCAPKAAAQTLRNASRLRPAQARRGELRTFPPLGALGCRHASRAA